MYSIPWYIYTGICSREQTAKHTVCVSADQIDDVTAPRGNRIRSGIEDHSGRRTKIFFIISDEEERFHPSVEMQEIKNFIQTLTNRFGECPEKMLFQAAVNGDTTIVERAIMEDNVAIDFTDDNNWNALTYAAMAGNTEVFLLLASKGGELLMDRYGRTAFIWASQNGLFTIVEHMLREKMIQDINLQDNIGWTALMEAAWNGHEDIVKLLISYGADWEVQDGVGWSALLLAFSKGHKTISDALLEHGAHLDTIDDEDEGMTALIRACDHGNTDLAVQLVTHGANVNYVTENGETALSKALNNSFTSLVELLLRHGAHVEPKALENAINNIDILKLILDKSTLLEASVLDHLLLTACDRVKYDAALLLLDRGANVNAIDENKSEGGLGELLGLGCSQPSKFTPLLYASTRKSIELSRLLIARGANVNAQGCFGFTPLLMANDEEIIELLLIHGADVNATDYYDEKVHGHTELMNLPTFYARTHVLYFGTDGCWTALHWAVYFGSISRVKLLLSYGANVEALSRTERSPIHAIFIDQDIQKNALDMIQLLVSEGSNVNHGCLNGIHGSMVPRRSLLYQACYYQRQDIAEGLIMLGCIYEHVAFEKTKPPLRKHLLTYIDNAWCQSSLHTACYKNDLNRLKSLISTQVPRSNLNLKLEDGWTPLHVAVLLNRLEAATLLVDAGADIFAATKNGHTVLHLAMKLLQPGKMVEVLLCRLKPGKAPSEMSVKELKAAIQNVGLTSQSHGFSEKSEFVQLLEKHYTTILTKEEGDDSSLSEIEPDSWVDVKMDKHHDDN
jgi:uncharacterized protein